MDVFAPEDREGGKPAVLAICCRIGQGNKIEVKAAPTVIAFRETDVHVWALETTEDRV